MTTPVELRKLVQELSSTATSAQWQILEEIFTASRRFLRQNGDAWRHGPERIRQVATEAYAALSPFSEIRGKSYMELGCGRYHPFGVATFFYLNGARRGIGIDISPFKSERAAEALYDLLCRALAIPAEWHQGAIPLEEFLDRIRTFDLKALGEGKLSEGIRRIPFEHHLSNADTLSKIEDGAVDLMSSRAVLEHIEPFESTIAEMHRIMAPGAVAFHAIDLVDHRGYESGREEDYWLFQTIDDPLPVYSWVNRLRAPEIMAIFKRAGFEILGNRSEQLPLPNGLRERLKPEYRRFTDLELATVSLSVTVRRPVRVAVTVTPKTEPVRIDSIVPIVPFDIPPETFDVRFQPIEQAAAPRAPSPAPQVVSAADIDFTAFAGELEASLANRTDANTVICCVAAYLCAGVPEKAAGLLTLPAAKGSSPELQRLRLATALFLLNDVMLTEASHNLINSDLAPSVARLLRHTTAETLALLYGENAVTVRSPIRSVKNGREHLDGVCPHCGAGMRAERISSGESILLCFECLNIATISRQSESSRLRQSSGVAAPQYDRSFSSSALTPSERSSVPNKGLLGSVREEPPPEAALGRAIRPLRIAFITHVFPRLHNTFILAEIVELLRAGHDVRILSLSRSKEKVVNADIERYRLLERTVFLEQFAANCPVPMEIEQYRAALPQNFDALPAAARWLTDEQVDVIHGAFGNRPATAALALHRLTGIPFSFETHAFDLYVDFPHGKEKCDRALGVITISEANRRFLSEQVGADHEKVCVLPVVPNTEAIAALPPVEKVPGSVVTACRLHPIKGLPTALKAIAELKGRVPALRYTVVGDGPLRPELEQLAKNLGIAHLVSFLGDIPNEEVLKTIAAASVFLLPSVIAENGDRDGTPTAIIESMFLGIPVVSTRVSGIPEVVADGETGLLSEPDQVSGIAEALFVLLSDGETRRRFGAAAMTRAHARHNLRRNVDQLVRLWRAATNSEGRREAELGATM